MNLSLYQEKVFTQYKSNSQIVRVLSENWFSSEMYCPRCLNSKILPFANNNPVADFSCPSCMETFQLKSQKTKIGKRILDGAYNKMINSICQNKRPSFFLLHYNQDYYIQNLFVIPHFFFVETLVEKRKPLSKTARRAGWIGCNLLLQNIPPEGKIKIIWEGNTLNPKSIRNEWGKIEFVKKIPLPERGWTIDVLNKIHLLNKKGFSLKDIYGFEDEFSKLHPGNQHIKDKIRQQLQILRDKRIIAFKSKGEYSLL